ncbi:MFS transporter [Amycolatopsis sp. NPDC051071]|uniref:MFS transporter n=1 Tax=Amycolatopsis sp. NPDC051071 TaxID=3154637 RepID=UPI003437B492
MKKIWIWALFAGAFAVSCTEFVVVGLLPQIAADLGVSEAVAGQLVTLNAVAFAVGAPVLGAAFHRMDRRKVLFGSLVVFAIGHATAGLAPNYPVLLGSRLLSGGMMGLYLATAIGTAARLSEPAKRASTMALIVAGVSSATALGVPVSTLMGQHLGWRAPMLVIGGMALAALAFIAMVVPATGADDGPPLSERVRALGTKPVVIGLGAIVLFWGASFTVYTYLVPLLEQRAGVHGILVIVVLFIAGLCAVLGNIIGGKGADRNSRLTLLVTAGVTAASLLLVLPLSTGPVQAIALITVWQLAAWSFVPTVQAALFQAAGKGGELAVSFAVSAFNIGIVAGAGFGGVALARAGLPGVAVLGASLGVIALVLVILLVRQVRKQEAEPARHEFDAVLFDLDGTLIDSTAAVRRAWQRWAEEEGVDKERLAGTAGKPAKDIVAALLPPDRFEAGLARYAHIATHDLQGVVVLPGAREATEATGERKAIVTSCTRDVTDARTAAAGLPVTDVLVTADDVERGKPEPAPYLLGAELLGVAPERCLAVEDTASGLASGTAAGCVTLGIGDADRLDADIVVPDLSHVRFEVVGDKVALTVGS